MTRSTHALLHLPIALVAPIALGWAGTATAQGKGPPGIYTPATPQPVGVLYPSVRRAVVAPSSEPDFQQLAFGNVFGNEERTLLATIGNEQVFLQDPIVFNVQIEIDRLGGVSSGCVLPGDDGAREQLFVAEQNGALVVDGKTDWRFGLPQVVQFGTWTGAFDLQAHEYGGDSFVAGVSQDGLEILILTSDGVGGWISDVLYTSSDPILDLTFVDADDDATPEAAILTETGLSYVSFGGSVIGTVPTNFPGFGGWIETVRGGAAELLAWVDGADSASPTLRLFDFLAETPQSLTLDVPVTSNGAPKTLDVAGLAAGDCNEDGLDDLVVSDFDSHRAVLLLNQGDAFSASNAGDHYLLHTRPVAGTAGPENDCKPLIADVDGDGKGDVVFGLDSTDEYVFFTDVPSGTQPLVLGLSPSFLSTATAFNFPNPSFEFGELLLAFSLNSEIRNQFQGVQVTLFQQLSSSAPLVKDGYSNTIFPFETNFGQGEDPDQQWCSVETPEKEIIWFNKQHYHFRYRFVRFVGSGPNVTITSASPSATGGFTMNDGSVPQITTLDTRIFDYLDDTLGGTDGWLLEWDTVPSSQNLTAKHGPRLRSATGQGPGGGTAFGNNYLGALYIEILPPIPPPGEELTAPPPVSSFTMQPWI